MRREERSLSRSRVRTCSLGECFDRLEFLADERRYWGNNKATQKKFERDVFVKGDLYYRTGDALRRTPDGRWFFQDRLGDTFRWKSENVSTAEVAEVIGKFPGVVEANVYGVLVPGTSPFFVRCYLAHTCRTRRARWMRHRLHPLCRSPDHAFRSGESIPLRQVPRPLSGASPEIRGSCVPSPPSCSDPDA